MPKPLQMPLTVPFCALMVPLRPALLPSCFTMYTMTLCLAAWYEGGRGKRAVFWGTVGVVLGWPFVVVAILPVALGLATEDMALSPRILYVLACTAVQG